MIQAWRWFGPNDPVSLSDVRQAGATGIVTALHHIPNGEIWEPGEINRRKEEIETAGLTWSVVESLAVHEQIKTNGPQRKTLVQHYKQSLINLGKAGIKTVCYNFMPVLDWTRTDLNFKVDDGSEALKFDAVAFASFDLFMLKRKDALVEYAPAAVKAAEEYFSRLTDSEKKRLRANITAGLPGANEHFSESDFLAALEVYRNVDEARLRENLYSFLAEVVPVAEQSGVRLAIHPDDPPRPILGLPRVVSTEADISRLLEVKNSPNNGFTLCSGSLGVRPDNDLVGLMQRKGHRVNFLHLRSTKRASIHGLPFESFYEADHLEGDVDMVGLVKQVMIEEGSRRKAGRQDFLIPMRPDHGHRMLDDLGKTVNPGYSAIGRLRGLAELRGLERGLLDGIAHQEL